MEEGLESGMGSHCGWIAPSRKSPSSSPRRRRAIRGLWQMVASMVQTLSEKRWTCLVYATPSNLQHIRFQTGDIPLRFAVRGDRSISNDPKDWAIQMPLGADCLLALDEVTPAGELLSEGLHCIDPSKPMGIWDAPGLTVRIL